MQQVLAIVAVVLVVALGAVARMTMRRKLYNSMQNKPKSKLQKMLGW